MSATPAGGATTTALEGAWRPALAPALMLRHDPVRDADLLVMPERVVVLEGHAGRIVALCDGVRTVRAIIDELAADHPSAPVATEVPAFLTRLRREGWLG
ncbi:pyrroloquinoline quinone biosynthesis peptide chaperone PqqD [Streptomyces sp. NPDC002328]|uniref:pyrroloquinoline quinone biosynthesis peptide chaperone PqqD n=1 Tax=Streptomyces sp. NPDC002328 TaxID=3364642 RepID=UPI003695BA14